MYLLPHVSIFIKIFFWWISCTIAVTWKFPWIEKKSLALKHAYSIFFMIRSICTVHCAIKKVNNLRKSMTTIDSSHVHMAPLAKCGKKCIAQRWWRWRECQEIMWCVGFWTRNVFVYFIFCFYLHCDSPHMCRYVRICGLVYSLWAVTLSMLLVCV